MKKYVTPISRLKYPELTKPLGLQQLVLTNLTFSL